MSAATDAIEAVLTDLRDAGLDATADAGALAPHPIGILVGLPSFMSRTLSGGTYSVPVTVITGDPLSTLAAVERLYAAADAAADAVGSPGYAPSSLTLAGFAEPLPSLELTPVVYSLSRNGG